MTRAAEPGSVAHGDAAREVESLAGASAPPEEHDRDFCLWCQMISPTHYDPEEAIAAFDSWRGETP